MNKVILEGDLVKIKLPYQDIRVTPGMRKYDGQEAAISKKVTYKIPVYTELGIRHNIWTWFELDGVVSEYGIPYSFNKDMLASIER